MFRFSIAIFFSVLSVGQGFAQAASTPSAVSLGNVNKTNVLKTGSLTTTTTTADQVVLTYTVTTGKTLYLQYLSLDVRLTAVSATATVLGSISLETPSGTKVITHTTVNPTTSQVDRIHPYSFSEPYPIASAVVVRVVCTPAIVTSTLWIANFGGYEK